MLTFEIIFGNDERAKGIEKQITQNYPDLKSFDPSQMFSYYNADHEPISDQTHRLEMGKIIKLIRRMPHSGATIDELNRAIHHAFVVCDAKKYDLDWRKSRDYYDIKELEQKYPFQVDSDN